MKCRICNSSKIVEAFNLGRQPIANKYSKNKLRIPLILKFKNWFFEYEEQLDYN